MNGELLLTLCVAGAVIGLVGPSWWALGIRLSMHVLDAWDAAPGAARKLWRQWRCVLFRHRWRAPQGAEARGALAWRRSVCDRCDASAPHAPDLMPARRLV